MSSESLAIAVIGFSLNLFKVEKKRKRRRSAPVFLPHR